MAEIIKIDNTKTLYINYMVNEAPANEDVMWRIPMNITAKMSYKKFETAGDKAPELIEDEWNEDTSADFMIMSVDSPLYDVAKVGGYRTQGIDPRRGQYTNIQTIGGINGYEFNYSTVNRNTFGKRYPTTGIDNTYVKFAPWIITTDLKAGENGDIKSPSNSGVVSAISPHIAHQWLWDYKPDQSFNQIIACYLVPCYSFQENSAYNCGLYNCLGYNGFSNQKKAIGGDLSKDPSGKYTGSLNLTYPSTTEIAKVPIPFLRADTTVPYKKVLTDKASTTNKIETQSSTYSLDCITSAQSSYPLPQVFGIISTEQAESTDDFSYNSVQPFAMRKEYRYNLKKTNFAYTPTLFVNIDNANEVNFTTHYRNNEQEKYINKWSMFTTTDSDMIWGLIEQIEGIVIATGWDSFFKEDGTPQTPANDDHNGDKMIIDGKTLTGSDITPHLNQPDYNPNEPPITPGGKGDKDIDDDNKYTDKVGLNNPKISPVGRFNRTYALSSSNVAALSQFIWNADETIFEEIIKGLGMLGANPMDGLIDLRMYPFAVNGGSPETIKLGRTDTKVGGNKLDTVSQAVYDLGSCSFVRKNKNYLDYEPYTSAELYIPYCGKIPIPTSVFVNHRISVKLIVDFITGAGTAIIFCDDIAYGYAQGTIGISIPMTGTDSARYASTVLNGAMQTAGTVASGVVSLTSGVSALHALSAPIPKTIDGITPKQGGSIMSGISSIAQGIEKIGFAAANPIPINQVMYQTVGSSSPSCSLWQPMTPYLIVRRPVVEMPKEYGHMIGYACRKTGTIDSFKGFAQFANADLKFSGATEEEKAMIHQQLQAGVYI